METAKPAGGIHADISGKVDGQIAVGTNIVQWNIGDGSTVVVSSTGEIARPRRRPGPVRLVGREPRALLGRAAEVAVAERDLIARTTVAIHGEGGVGKSSMLKALAHGQAGAELDGIVYLDVHDQPLEDLLQLLFDVFYECDVPYKPMPGELRTYLHDLRALVVLDEVSMDREAMQDLLDTLPDATFLCASRQSVHLDDSTVLALRGLPEEAALALLERQLGRALNDAELPAAEELCRASGGKPLLLIQAAALVRESDLPFAEITHRLRRSGSVSGDLLASAGPDARTVVAALVSVAGRSVPAHLVSRVSGLTDAASALASLVERGLVQAEDERYRVTPTTSEASVDLTPWPARWSIALSEWADALKAQPEVVAREAELIAHVIDVASRAGQWPEVLRLCQATNAALLVSRRWETWKRSLERGRTAAVKLGETAALAWFLNQLGNRAASLSQGSGAPQSTTAPAQSEVAHRTGTAQHPGWRRPARTVRRVARAHPLRIATAAVLAASAGAGVVQALGTSGDGPPPPPPILPELVAAPQSIDFDSVPVGTAGVPATVTFGNVTGSRQQVSTVDIAGTHADDFLIDADHCSGSTVEMQGRCTVVISFHPTNPGPRSAALSVTSGNGARAATVVLGGVGVGGDGDVVADPSLMDFGTQRVSVASSPRPVTVRPVDSREVRVSSVTVSGPHAADFSLRNACPVEPLPPGGCTIEVVFTPSASGTRGAEVVIQLAERPEPIAVAVTGRGVSPTSQTTTSTLSPPTPTTSSTVGPGQPVPPTPGEQALGFGEFTVNTTSAVRKASLRNEGPSDVAVQEVSVADANATDFVVSENTCQSLAPGATCEVGVRFTARGIGARSATLVISHSAPGGPVRIGLTATSVPRTVGMTLTPGGDGYVLLERSGRLYSFGTPTCPAQGLNPNSVGVAAVANGPTITCWVAASNGTVVGSNGTTGPPADRRAPIVGIAAERDGYWLVTSAGEVFATNALFAGDTRAIQLKSPIVALEPTATLQGYWLVAADGGVFAFGDANFYGSTGNIQLQSPVVGMERSGNGYWIVTANGQIYAYGSAPFKGDLRNLRLTSPVTAVAGTLSGSGYWMIGAEGGVYTFGDAEFLGAAP